MVAPVGRDSRLVCDMLGKNGITCERLTNVGRLCEELSGGGGAGAILLTEEALGPGALEALADALGVQPKWSDVPVLLLTAHWQRLDAAARRMFRERGARGNLVIIEKPVRPLSLRSAVDAALTARTRQYELHRDQEELRTLTARLIEVQETEGKHLARELHDDFCQKLAVLGMEMAALADGAGRISGELGRRLLEVTNQVGTLAKDVHRISRQIHPAILDDLGLVAALQNECDIFSEQYRVPVEFDSRDVERPVPDAISLCLYRVVQESLRNIGRHAHAKKVRVLLNAGSGEVVMEIADAGTGFELEEIKGTGGLGLISMGERVRLLNGAFSIQSQRGQGTLVRVRIPIPETEIRDTPIASSSR